MLPHSAQETFHIAEAVVLISSACRVKLLDSEIPNKANAVTQRDWNYNELFGFLIYSRILHLLGSVLVVNAKRRKWSVQLKMIQGTNLGNREQEIWQLKGSTNVKTITDSKITLYLSTPKPNILQCKIRTPNFKFYFIKGIKQILSC